MNNVFPFQPRDPATMSYENLISEANALIEATDSEDGGTEAQHARCRALLDELEVRRSE